MAVCKSCGHAFEWRPESVEDVAVCPACFSTVRHPDAPAPRPVKRRRPASRDRRPLAGRVQEAADRVAKGAFSAGCALFLFAVLFALLAVVLAAVWSALGL